MNDFLLTATARGRRCLQALLAVHKGQAKLQAAQTAQVSLRTLQRWLMRFKTRGLRGLTTIWTAGRRRKISMPELDSKVSALIKSAPTRNIATIRRQLAQEHQIHLSYSTLRRYLILLGYRARNPDASQQPSEHRKRLSTEKPWTKPWPREYGESLADYLAGR